MHSFCYFGTPVFSTFVLDELARAGLTPSLIVTTPDKPAGRGLHVQKSPVKSWAKTHNIQTLEPEHFDESVQKILANLAPEFFVVAAYGKILPKSVLSIPKKGSLNVHPSLLPRYRGTSPVESQILADERELGVSVIVMDEKMDHGPVLAQERIDVPDWPVSRNILNERLWHAGGKLLAESIPAWLSGTASQKEQTHEDATFTKKMTKESGLISLDASGRENYLKYLAFEGWPGTFFYADKDGKKIRVKIKTATFESGVFAPIRIVPEGKKETNYSDFVRV